MAEIEYDVSDQVATLTINRPEKVGAMTYRMPAQFRDGIGRANADPEVRVLVVTGRSGSFCSCFASVDHAEGVAAFLEGRPAHFSGG